MEKWSQCLLVSVNTFENWSTAVSDPVSQVSMSMSLEKTPNSAYQFAFEASLNPIRILLIKL